MTSKIKPIALPWLLILLNAFMAACAPLPLPSADKDRAGIVRKVWLDQTANPQGTSALRPPPLSSGSTAKASIERWQKSFESPPAPVNVLNMGVGTSSSHGSGR